MAQPTKKSCPTQLIPTDPIDLTNLLDLIDPISPIEKDTFWRIKELVSEALVGGAEPGVSAGADRQGDPQAGRPTDRETHRQGDPQAERPTAKWPGPSRQRPFLEPQNRPRPMPRTAPARSAKRDGSPRPHPETRQKPRITKQPRPRRMPRTPSTHRPERRGSPRHTPLSNPQNGPPDTSQYHLRPTRVWRILAPPRPPGPPSYQSKTVFFYPLGHGRVTESTSKWPICLRVLKKSALGAQKSNGPIF